MILTDCFVHSGGVDGLESPEEVWGSLDVVSRTRTSEGLIVGNVAGMGRLGWIGTGLVVAELWLAWRMGREGGSTGAGTPTSRSRDLCCPQSCH